MTYFYVLVGIIIASAGLISGFVLPLSPARLLHKSYRFSKPVATTGSQMQLKFESQSAHSYLNLAKAMYEEEVEEEESEARPATTEAPSMSGISLHKEGISFSKELNGSDIRVGIIATRWNTDIISGLQKGVNESLAAAGVKPSNIFLTYVPGAYEIPLTAKFLAASNRFDVIICLGCLIKGDTMHFEYIAEAASSGIMRVQLDTMVPMIFGVLTVLNKEQAIVRSVGARNEGLSWGKTAVEMALARLSALGVGRTHEINTAANSFVTFEKGDSITKDDKTTKSLTNKNFGF